MSINDRKILFSEALMEELPASDVQKQEILQKVAAKLLYKRYYTEDQVNKIVKSAGFEDLALIRKELINFNYMGKETHKGYFWLKKNKMNREDMAKIEQNQKRMQA